VTGGEIQLADALDVCVTCHTTFPHSPPVPLALPTPSPQPPPPLPLLCVNYPLHAAQAQV